MKISDCSRNSDNKKSFKDALELFKVELLSTGYTEDIINSYVKYKYKHRHFVYYKMDKIDNSAVKFIVTEADSCSGLINEFVRSNNKFYELEFCLVEKNYSKLIAELNHAALKVLDNSNSLFE